MKTIAIKLAEDEFRELNEFIKRKNYPSESEFIRHLILSSLDSDKKEKNGWMVLAEKSMEKIWNNEKDDKVWRGYL